MVLSLTAEEDAELRSRLRAHTTSQRDVLRARIVLACTERRSAEMVARELDVDVKTVEVWRGRFFIMALRANEWVKSGLGSGFRALWERVK